MNAKEKAQLEALMRQADFHAERFDKRRDYSWKVALAFCGAILGASTLLKDSNLSICDILVGGVLVMALHAFWLRSVFEADQKDKLVLFQCRDASLAIVNKAIKPQRIEHPKSSTERIWLQDWSVQFQLGTTILLVFAISRLVLP